jgi:CheY-like chemotaxis protein
MVESLSPSTEEPRVADAVARLLARQADLLAQAEGDEAAAASARLGLSWLADLLRSFDLAGASDWFQALRARGDAIEDRVTASWPVVGAPLCHTLAVQVRRAGSLAPVSEIDWDARVEELIEFAEPEPEPEIAVAPEPEPEPEPAPEPVVDHSFATELDLTFPAEPELEVAYEPELAPEVNREPVPPPIPEIEPDAAPEPEREPDPAPEPIREPDPPAEPVREPETLTPERAPEREPEDAHAAVFEAIADLAGSAEPEVDARHGRIEIAALHTLPEGEMDAATGMLLRALDTAAREAGAVLLVDAEAGMVRWRVRLPKPSARHYLFVELEGAALAVPWSRVVEYGLAGGSERPRVVLGAGLERLELPIDWLFGKGEGRPAHAPSDLFATAYAAPEAFELGAWVADADGRVARVLDLTRGAEIPLEPAEVAPVEAAEEPAAIEPEIVPEIEASEAPEAVQPEPVPADNVPEDVVPVAPRAPRALVADDSMMARVFLGRLLAQRGIEVEEAENGMQARAALLSRDFDLVFLDAEMPGPGAVELLASGGVALAARTCVLVKDDEERRRAESLGAVPILYKPFAEDEVRSAVDALLARDPSGD